MNDEHDEQRIRLDRVERVPDQPLRNKDEPWARRRDEDDVRPPSGGRGIMTVVIVLAAIGVLGFCVIAGIVGGGYLVLKGAVSKVQLAAARAETSNNYKQIALAMHNYYSANGTLPPVSMPTKKGQGLSWRVALLPYLEQDVLYRQFKIDEPWDHPDNLRLAAQMPDVFSPGRGVRGDKTHVRLFVGPRAIFDREERRKLEAINDGTSNTLMFVEATDPVLWIQPLELPFDPKGPIPPLGLKDHDYFQVAFADGSVRTIKKSVSVEKIKLLIDYKDGQVVNLDE